MVDEARGTTLGLPVDKEEMLSREKKRRMTRKWRRIGRMVVV